MRGEFRVKGYELGSLLAASASGEVWLAQAHGSGEQVALKRLRLRSAESLSDAERLMSLLALLDHPHVLRIRELLPYGDEVVVVLDHAEGGSLDQLLSSRGGLDPGEVVTAVAPVAEALHAAHERGLVHGDITPETILFTADGRPLLADLGLLPLVDGAESLGTHGYADPVGVSGAAPTAAGDVYGVAAVCYTALTGLPPRPGQPRLPLAEAAPGLPSELAHAVAAGLQAVPARRPDAGQFADLLYGACAPVPVRFPVGLVLSDADIAAVLGEPAGSDTSAPAPAAARQDPFVLGLAGGGAGGLSQDAGNGQVAAFGAGPEPDEIDDDDGRRRRLWLLLGGGGLALLLVATAVVAGVALGLRAGPDRPTALAGDGEATGRGNAADVPAPQAPGRDSPARPNSTAGPDGPPTSAPDSTTAPATTAAPDGTRPRQAPAADSSVDSWGQVLSELDEQRAKAFAESDAAMLRSVYVRGSDLLVKDRAEIEKCVRAGCHVEGLRFDIIRLELASKKAGRTVLKVVDQLQAYTVVSGSGERTDRPPGEVTTRLITLERRPGDHWLISRIVAE